MNELIENPTLYGYIDAVLHGPFMEEKNFRFVFSHEESDKALRITFEGWTQVTFTTQSSALNEVLNLCRENLKMIKKTYEKEYMFFPPTLIVNSYPLTFHLEIKLKSRKKS